MDRLPPELLISIIELYVPPAHLSTIQERYAALRTLALISQQWRAVAQGLLFQTVIFQFLKGSPTIPPQLQQLNSSLRTGSREVHELRISSYRPKTKRDEVPAFPILGNLMGRAAASLFLNKAMDSLRSLALSGVYFTADLLPELKGEPGPISLEALRIFKVTFRDAETARPLLKLSHLQLQECSHLPLCLHSAQLPSLKVIGIGQNCTSLDKIVQDFLALTNDSLQHFSVGSDFLRNLSSINTDCILIDVEVMGFLGGRTRSTDDISFRKSLKHIRIFTGAFIDLFWDLRLHENSPDLQTIVLPFRTECRSLLEDPSSAVARFVERHNVKILIEEEGIEGDEEMDRQLSKAFMKYRHIPFGWR